MSYERRPIVEQFGQAEGQIVEVQYSAGKVDCFQLYDRSKFSMTLLPWEVDDLICALATARRRAREQGLR